MQVPARPAFPWTPRGSSHAGLVGLRRPGAETLSLTDRRNTCSWVPPLGLLLGEMAGSLNC